MTREEFLSALDEITAMLIAAEMQQTREAVEQARNEIFGRKSGRLTQLSKELPSLPPEDRRVVGARLNQL
jgi:phenylalanyl-tRNA synthetase alpha subunit